MLSKAKRVNNGQIEKYGVKYYDATPSKTMRKGVERYTVALSPSENLNSLEGRMEMITDKQVEEQIKKCK